ncbi:glycosyltransferase [Hungatella effluvii]|uniref:glycosyltransferase n=1 Tax=Hungatella effluvii TaxID=1096246 RepID=UPI0022E15CFB|nr:glycosyltransferase [Hungatella effluvii]
MKNFVTLFPKCTNIELIKDVGMIPYILQKYYGWTSTIACYSGIEELPHLTDELNGLNLKRVKRYTFLDSINGIFFILKNYNNIDVLNIYHINTASFLWGVCYKFLRPDGILYLKADLDKTSIERHLTSRRIKKIIKQYFIKKVNYLSAETTTACNLLEEGFNAICHYIPNGYYKFTQSHDEISKENIFLTVGRMGSTEKNTETLVKAFINSSDSHDWSLVLIGSSTSEFESYINRIYNKYPQLKSRIITKGVIKNRDILFQEYSRAKVFCLTSYFESFGIVLVEALAGGCHIISSDTIPTANDIATVCPYIQTFPFADIDKLSKLLVEATQNSNYDKDSKLIKLIAEREYNWIEIVQKIDILLEGKQLI